MSASPSPAPPSATGLPAPTEPPTIAPTSPSTAVLPTADQGDATPGDPVAPRYAFPVRGKPIEYGRYHHDYPAADIFCPIGSEFLAPTSGIVDFVSTEDLWEPATNRPEHRGGLSVAIVGDDGVRYYGSHLSAVAEGIAPGARVEAGQLLGLTGKSGNARGTPAHLHFGISRPSTPEDWQTRRGQIPPYEYLKAWERGEQTIPVLD